MSGVAGASPGIEVTGVSVRYRDIVALDDVNLTVTPGRVTALIGMNGSGKSTLFKSITGLVRPASGRVSIAGQTPAVAAAAASSGTCPRARTSTGPSRSRCETS